MTPCATAALRGRASLSDGAQHLSARLHRDHALVETADVDMARCYMEVVVAPHVLTVPGRGRSLRFRHSALELDQIKVNLIEYATNADWVEINAEAMGGDVVLKIPLTGEAQVIQGRRSVDLRPGQVYLTQPGQSFISRLSGDYSHLSVQIKPTLLGVEAGNLNKLDFDNDAINNGGAGRVLSNAMVAACSMLTHGALDPVARKVVARAQSDMLRAMVIALPRRGRSETDVAPYYIRKVETYMRRNLTEELDMEDLVRISGVSRRSLHAAFRRYRDSSPMKFFKDMRLTAAHEDLQRCCDRDNSVTEIATRYNFFQLSKFSRDFQAQFGQLPSQLRRQRQD
jgi:AraC-like DNA-binding protein